MPKADSEITRVRTSDNNFVVEFGDRTEFFVAGSIVDPETFIASVLVEWFDQLNRNKQAVSSTKEH